MISLSSGLSIEFEQLLRILGAIFKPGFCCFYLVLKSTKDFLDIFGGIRIVTPVGQVSYQPDRLDGRVDAVLSQANEFVALLI